MLTIECTGKQARVFYLIALGLSLFFILVNWPPFLGISRSITTTQHSFRIVHFIEGQLDLKREGVLATWYSSIILFATGVVALLNCRTGPSSGWLMWLNRAGWMLIALVLVGLSADEVAQVHESLANLLNSAYDGAPLREGAGDWIPILLPFIVFVALFMILFFLVVIRKSKVSMALALLGIICWTGAIFSEAIEAGFWRLDMAYAMRGFIEESLELLGTTCLLIAFLEFNLRQRLNAQGCALAQATGLTAASERKDDTHPSPPAPGEVSEDSSRGAGTVADPDSVGSQSGL